VTRVLLLIKGLGRGGAQRLLLAAAPHLDRERFDYEVVFLLPEQDALAPDLERRRLRVTCLDGSRGASWVLRLRSLVRTRRIDVVHAHSPYAAAGARIAVPRRVRLVYTEHNVWESYHRATYYANAVTYWRNDHVFAVSDQVAASVRYPLLVRRAPVPPIETLYHGYDERSLRAPRRGPSLREELGIPSVAPTVGTVAHFLPHKGHRHLLAAAAEVRRKVPEARFVLVGDGPLRSELRRRARELALEETVLFAGDRADAPRLAAEFDLVVFPSLYEGLSVALLEAMAHARPAVVTSAAGELVRDGRECLVVPPGDDQALAGAILRLLGDEALRARLGESARRRAVEFDIRHAVSRMEEVYAELVG
jgi:glycosyltransferase involved in cell wall biosynthesis